MKARLHLAAATLAILMTVLGCVGAAHAAYPGLNGKIAFTDSRTGTKFDLVTMAYDGSGEATLTDDSQDVWQPAWSPDGTKIAFSRYSGPASRADIWTINANGTGLQQVTSIFGQDRYPTWSPDGTKIAFSTSQVGNSEIYVVNADGSGLQNITNNTENQDTAPAWSPDGAKIAYLAQTSNSSPNVQHIWVMDADGSDQTQLPPTFTSRPDWSPDSSRVVYSEDCGGGSTCIRVMEPDGTNDNVVHTGSATHPKWSPDGTKFVVTIGQAIATMNVDGTGTVVIAPNFGWGRNDPDWGPTFVTGHIRPKGASPVKVPLVPAFSECISFDRNHGPPLAYLSCNPPVQQSDTLTVGTPDANANPAESEGSVRLAVVVGNPATPADEADVEVDASVTDVRCRDFALNCPGGPNSDYAGGLTLDVGLRLTDKLNGPSANESATVQGTSLTVPMTCATTGSAPGSTCSVATTADAVIPGMVTEKHRSVWQLGQVTVLDGDDVPFLRQGLFIP